MAATAAPACANLGCIVRERCTGKTRHHSFELLGGREDVSVASRFTTSARFCGMRQSRVCFSKAAVINLDKHSTSNRSTLSSFLSSGVQYIVQLEECHSVVDIFQTWCRNYDFDVF